MSDRWILKYKILALSLILGLLISLGAYFYKQHLDRIHEEEIKKPYKEAGLSDEQAEEFLAKYPGQNGNYTWVSFAKSWANDKTLADESLKIFGNLKESLEYLYFANSNGYDGLNYLKDFPQLAKNYKEVLPAYSVNSTLVKTVYDQFQRDSRISFDRNELFLKGLKEYQDLNLINKNLMIQTIHALNNLTLAYYQQGLPKLDKNTVWLLTNATQISKDIADFSPIIFYSVDGNNYVLESDVARNTWILAEHLKRIEESGFNIIEHPEMFEGLNGKVIANAYSLFDAKYGVSYAENFKSGRIIKPSDRDVLDLMMLQWSLYSNKAPQLNGSEKLYNRDFPWYDSAQLKQLYPDKNTRRQALFFLFYIPNTTFDTEKKERAVGLEGARLSLTQSEKEYEAISNLYPNGSVQHLFGLRSPRYDYYGWLVDRQHHGLDNTVHQFTGVRKGEYGEPNYTDNFIELVNQRNGIDQHLTKNWKYFDIAKFAAGYERWNPKVPEIEGINDLIPQTLKAFGFPVYWITQDHSPPGAIGYEWAISLPQYVEDNMRKEFGDKIVFGPANLFGLYACKEGLIKDGATEILVALYAPKNYPYEAVRIYLMKKP